MGVAFTDLLIELSQPSRRAKFMEDPKRYLRGRDISDKEIELLRSGDTGRFWAIAQSTELGDPNQQFNRHATRDSVTITPAHIIEAFIELHTEHHVEHSMSTITSGRSLVVGEDGRIYQVVSD